MLIGHHIGMLALRIAEHTRVWDHLCTMFVLWHATSAGLS